MKIVFSDATLMHGGAERVISILANKLVRLGHDVTISLYYNKPIWYELDPRIKVINDEDYVGKTRVLSHILYKRNLYKNMEFDVLISFLAPVNIVNILSMIGLKKKLIVADRNDPSRIPNNYFIRKIRDILYLFSNRVVVQSVNNKKYFSRTIQNKCDIIFNPIDLDDKVGTAISSEKKDEIVVVGRIIKQKNPLMALEAFSMIASKYPSYNLVYYGDGDMLNIIKKRAKELNLNDRVQLRGAQKNIFDAIKTAKLFIMTSLYEGMPNALIEAMCIGLPVISTAVSGAVDLIKNGENGFLVEVGNIKELAQKMDLLLGDSGLLSKFAKSNLELNERLSTDKIIKEWLMTIDKTI